MLPKNLKYGTKVESAIARSSRVNIAPQNGTAGYGLGDTIILNLPTRNNLVLVPTESYLKFNLQVRNGKANNAFRWDSCGAHGLIQRIRIFHGSNLIQDIDNYGLLAKVLFDLQQPTDATFGKQTMLAGTRSDTVASNATISTANATDLASAQNLANDIKTSLNTNKLPGYQVNSGERIGGDLKAVTASTYAADNVAGTITETYCLNLVSLVGSLCSANYIPLFAMTSAPLRVEILLVDNFVKACSDMASTTLAEAALINITNCEYVANFIELGDPAMQIIYSSLQGEPLQFVVPDFRNYQFSLTLTQNVSTQVAMPIPAKFSSLKALLVTARDKGTGTYGGFFPFSSVTTGIQDYQFRIGSQIMPPKSPSTLAEMYSETLKAMGSIGDINYQPSIDKKSYATVSSTASTDSAVSVSSVSSGSFYIGLDLENYCAAPKDTIFAGYNSNTDDVFFVGNFYRTDATAVIRFDAFANFDSVVVCDNNTCYVRF
jgi:hypothetical protein